MVSDNLTFLLDQIYTGARSDRLLHFHLGEYAQSVAKKRGFQQHSIKAAARRAIMMLVARAKNDKGIQKWPEVRIQSLLCEYVDQQWILHNIRYNKFLEKEEYVAIRRSCEYHINLMVDENGKGNEIDIETLIEVAFDRVDEIFWRKIQNPDFELTSTFSTYVDGLARNVVYELFRAQKQRIAEKYTEPNLNEVYPDDIRQRLFDEIENQLLLFENKQCQDMLLTCFQLFKLIVDEEEVKATEIPALRRTMIQELANVLGIDDKKRPDKAFDHCYKTFVIQSFPVLYNKLGGEFPLVGRVFTEETKKYMTKHQNQKKAKRDYKQNSRLNVFLLWS